MRDIDADRDMQILVQGKQLDVGDALRERIENAVEQISTKYFSDPIDATVTMSRAGASFKADVNVHVGKGITAQAVGEAGDAHGAFDAAEQRLDKQLRRYKRRLRDHHRGYAGEAAPALSYVLAAEDDDAPEPEGGWEPVVVAETETRIETLTVGAAVMRLDLSTEPALMFRNEAHGGLNMVYRRADGNIGWVDPTNAQGT